MSDPSLTLKPPPGGTRLVLSPSDRERLTAHRESDARTAPVRGLMEHLQQLRIDVAGGRSVQFRNVVDTWAEPEDRAEYPTAVVSVVGEATYDASKFTPSVFSDDRLALPDGRFLISPCDIVLPLQVEVWSNDPQERQACAAMLEDALLAPVDYMFGFALELPHYHNARAIYAVTGISYADSETDAVRRYRLARVSMTATMPVLRLVTFPVLANIRLRIDVVVEEP